MIDKRVINGDVLRTSMVFKLFHRVKLGFYRQWSWQFMGK